jgi:hypothetical protein
MSKMVKCPFLDKINKVVLPLMDFKVMIRRRNKLSGEVKILKIRQYRDITNFLFEVDISVKGLISKHRYGTHLSDQEIYDRYIENGKDDGYNYYIGYSSHSISRSRILYTANYDNLSKSEKSSMTSTIKFDLEDSIADKIRMIFYPVRYNYPSRVKIGKIKYE